MNTIIIARNPFNPADGREFRRTRGRVKVAELYKEFPDTEFTVFVDGKPRKAEYIAPKNSLVSVVPIVAGGKAKQIVGIVVMVGLAIATHGMTAHTGWASAAFGVGAKAGAIIAYASAAAIIMAGSVLVNRMTAQKLDVGKYDYENNPTYSWGEPQTTEGQNNPIPLTYGKVQSAGQTIGQYVSTDNDNNQILNWLIAAGEGPLEITDIRLNDNSIDYYTSVTAEIRSGTNDQTIISNFNDSYSTKALGYELTGTTARTDTTSGNSNEGLIIKLECSQGLYHANDNGSLGTAWVKCKVEYRKVGTTSWTLWLNEVQISGAQATAVRKEFRKDYIPAGQYEVRVQVVSRSASETSSRDSVKVWWTAITGIIYDDFTYPNIALIGIKGLATSQLNGVPALKFIKERKKVWVWDGDSYVEKPADNPAWASYDVLHQCRRLKDINTGKYVFDVRGVPAHSMMYERFSEWADFCEDKELYVNIELCTTGEMLDVVNNKIACIGRGTVVRFGTRYGCIWDSVQQPVQMFGMGNIIEGTFEETFLPVNDRANCIELTYTDADRDFTRQVITVYSDNYDNEVEKKAQITYDGITDYEQAFREAKFHLACNRYILKTVSFDADIDSIACMVGDVILVSHDAPKWGQSGRIYGVDELQLTLPVELDADGDYTIRYRTVNDNFYIAAIEVISSENGWSVVELPSGTTVLPEVNDIFTIGDVQHMAQPFKIVSIDRSQDFRRKITAREYNAAIYDESYDIPAITPSVDPFTADDVTGLQARQVAYTTKDGRKQSRLYASWELQAPGSRYSVAYSTDGATWHNMGTTQQDNIYADVEPFNIYYVRVITQLGIAQSRGVIAYPVLPGEDSLPPNVAELNVERIADGTRRYYWDFEYPDPNDIAGFRIKVIAGSQPNWNLGADVQEGLITSQPYEATTVRQGTHTVMIKAVDNSGQESAGYASCVMDFGDVLADNVLQVVDFSDWEETAVEIKGLYVGTDGFLRSTTSSTAWTSANSEAWISASAYAWEAKFDDVYAEFEMTAGASGYWWLEYDISGAVRILYWLNDDGVRKQYSTRVKVKAGDVIHIAVEAEPTNVTIKALTGIVDVPDRTEHFEDITISTSGVVLPIVTPNYVTTAVRLDNVQGMSSGNYELQIVSREPCTIKINRIDNNASGTQTATAVTADITWQGYENEVITDDI